MGAGSWESYHAITTLMFDYAECVDQANFEGLGRLFRHGTIRAANTDPAEAMQGDAVRDFYASTNKVHPDGTLRTRHLSTNIRLDIDEERGLATGKSYYVVLQATPNLPFQPIAGGRYDDRFARVGGGWRFAERIIHVDQIGDVSEHLTFDLAERMGK